MNRHCNILVAAVFLLCTSVFACPCLAVPGGSATIVERARTCGVFPGTIDRIGGAILDGSLSGEEGEQLLGVLVAVCNAGVPLAPFEDKLAEGLAKRIAPFRIVGTLERKLDAYVFAQTLLQNSTGTVDPHLLIVVGEGMFEGVPGQVFQEYMTSFGSQPLEMLLTGAEMTSLFSQAGFKPSLIQSMLEAGFEAQSLSSQWRYVIRIALIARQRGMSDATIAQAVTAVLQEDGSLGDVSTRLGFTSRDMVGPVNSN